MLKDGAPRQQLLAMYEAELDGRNAEGRMLASTYRLLDLGLVERSPSDSLTVRLTEMGRSDARFLWERGFRAP